MKAGLSVLIALGWATAAVAQDAVFRDDFENGLGRWQTNHPQMWKVVDGAGEDGSKALVFETDGNTVAWPTVSFSVPCEPGRVYTLTYRVKVDAWKGSCCYSNLRWYGAGGASLGFAEGRPHFDQRKVGRGWITVCTRTARTCAGTRLLRFSVAPGGCKSARFTVDDVVLTADRPRFVESLHTSAYRDTAWGGEVTFVGEYMADVEAFPPDRLAPCFSFLGPDGSTQRVAGIVTNGAVRLTIPVERLAMGTHPVTLEFALAGKPPADRTSLNFTRTASPPDWCVRFDSCRRTIVDGRPFFPIGMCMGADHILTHPGSLERYREAGFNIVGFPSWDPNVKEEVLDRFASAGIRVLVNLDDKSPDIGRDALLKEAGDLVERLKGHPGVFGWQVIDEAPPVWVDRKRDLQELVRRLDPDHPTSAVFDKPSHVRYFLSAFDIVSVDPYPIGNSRGPIGISTSWQRECDEQTWGLKPMWQFPQAFNWGWWRSGPRRPDYRFPRAIECRSQAWQAIAAGANGLIWYAYDTEKRCDRCEPGGFAEQWLHVKVAAQEVLAHQDVLLADPGERVTSETPELSVRTWNHRGETWLLAVNTVTNAIRGTVAFGRDVSGDIKLALGAAMPTKVGARKLSFDVRSLDVVLCRIPPEPDRRPETASRAPRSGAAPTAPEHSRLFVAYDDPVSKVRSYLLRPGLLGHNQQSLYFTAKSMTDDGRFLVFDVSDKEGLSEPTGGEVRFNTRFRRKGVVDFLRDEAYLLQDVPGAIPFLDRKASRLYYVDYEAVHCRNLAGDPRKDEIVCRVPDEFRCAYPDPEQRVCTHLTLSPDRRKAFLDIRRADGRSDPGTLDLTTGAFARWTHFDFFANHGQFCPSDDGLAMVAREMAGNLTFDELTPEPGSDHERRAPSDDGKVAAHSSYQARRQRAGSLLRKGLLCVSRMLYGRWQVDRVLHVRAGG